MCNLFLNLTNERLRQRSVQADQEYLFIETLPQHFTIQYQLSIRNGFTSNATAGRTSCSRHSSVTQIIKTFPALHKI